MVTFAPTPIIQHHLHTSTLLRIQCVRGFSVILQSLRGHVVKGTALHTLYNLLLSCLMK